MPNQEKLVQWLFATRALRVAAADQPFWYASGALGPYYINTHFLYGSESAANDLLERIDALDGQPLELPPLLAEQVQAQYAACPLYRELCDLIAGQMQSVACDVISGGQRRDFFFSVMTAVLLDKPHVSLYKDGTVVLSQAGFTRQERVLPGQLSGLVATHLADLVTEASSYTRAWLPFLHQAGAVMPVTLAVVDRQQGGREALAQAGTRLISLVDIQPALFGAARAAGLIDARQEAQIHRFHDDPDAYVTEFLKEHPDFLDQQIALGGKNRERALRCLERGYGPKR
jgi:orotate phosphoribosyltransferase